MAPLLWAGLSTMIEGTSYLSVLPFATGLTIPIISAFTLREPIKEEILHVPETETEPVVQPHRVTDYLGRKSGSSVTRHTVTVPGPPSSWQSQR